MNRRNTFRAAVHQNSAGALIVARQLLRVRILDQSAGGICVIADKTLSLELGMPARLKFDDGCLIDVEVMHCTPEGSASRIGLKRLESTPRVWPQRPETRPIIVLAGIVGGLLVGLIVNHFR